MIEGEFELVIKIVVTKPPHKLSFFDEVKTSYAYTIITRCSARSRRGELFASHPQI